MVAKFLRWALIVSMVVATVIPEAAFAQNANGSSSQKSSTGSGPKRQLGIIVFSGVAGGLLGLSTLSFYGRPQEKLSNIAIGFAIGIIGGAVYTTYKAASAPRDFYHESTWQREQERDQELRYARGNAPIKASFTVLTF
jgi:hypothetical protein